VDFLLGYSEESDEIVKYILSVHSTNGNDVA